MSGLNTSPVAPEHGGYLCGNGEQAAMMELQNQMSEPGQRNKRATAM